MVDRIFVDLIFRIPTDFRFKNRRGKNCGRGFSLTGDFQ